jgi:hypothetical protein
LSNQAVQAVLERTLADEAFRAHLLTEPDAALADYDLTESEVVALRALRVDTAEDAGTELEVRQSKKPFWTEFF